MSSLGLNPPASSDEVAAVEEELGFSLPDDYRAFLLRHDGGQGVLGESYLVLWSVVDLAHFQRDHQVPSGLLLFGTNGAGEGFAFDLRPDQGAVIRVPLSGISLEAARRVADSFGAFLSTLERQGFGA